MSIARVTGTTPAFPTGNTGNGLGTLSVEFGQVGDLVILNASLSTTDAHIGTVGVSGTGETTAWQLVEASTASGSDVEQWYATVTVVGSASLNVEYSGSSVSGVHIELEADSLRSGLGAATVWQLLTSNTTNNGSSTSVDYPDLTSSGGLAFQAYYGYADLSEEGTSSVTSGFTASATADGNEIILNPSLAAATAYSPVGGQSPAGVSFAIGAIFAVAATAAGSFAFTGTAVGSIIATAAGSFAFTGTASGTLVLPATAAASFTFTGAATGMRPLPATGAAAFTFTGTATARAPSPAPTPVLAPTVYQPFTFLLCDLRSGTIKGEIPLCNTSWGGTLNGTAQFQGQIDMMDPNLAPVDLLDQTTPAKSALFIDYNGVLLPKGFIVWPRQREAETTDHKMTLTGVDLWSYFAQRAQATDYSSPPSSGITGPPTVAPNGMPIWNAAFMPEGGPASEWDPLLMAWQLISDALSTDTPYSSIMGGVAIAANDFTTTAGYLDSGTATPAGNYINITFPFTSLQMVATMVSQLCQLGLNVGFDVGMDCAYSAGSLSVPVVTVNLSYPRRGRTVAENNLFADLATALNYQFPEDGTQAANTVYESGGQGAISVTQNVYPLDQGYAELDVVKSRSQITSANVLTLLGLVGESDLAAYSYPVVTPQFTVDLFGDSPALGSFIEGDDIQVFLPATDEYGNVWDSNFPQGINEEWRISQYLCTCPDEGVATLQVTLNQPPAFFASAPAL